MSPTPGCPPQGADAVANVEPLEHQGHRRRAGALGLTQLRELNLRAGKVTDAGLAHVKGLTQLQWLDLLAPRSPMPGWNTSRG